jgi:hypothetical protein
MTTRKWKIVAAIGFIVAAIGFIVAAVCIVISYRALRRHSGQFDTAMIVTEIRPLNQLTTVRYSIQRVIGIREAKQPFGEESLLLMVQGDVLAGIDLARFSNKDIHFLNEHTVAVHLPPPTILQCFIDEKNTKVWDRQITWWTPWISYNPDLEHRARLSALGEINQAAISQGILAQAQKNAQTSIRTLLGALKIDVSFEGT